MTPSKADVKRAKEIMLMVKDRFIRSTSNLKTLSSEDLWIEEIATALAEQREHLESAVLVRRLKDGEHLCEGCEKKIREAVNQQRERDARIANEFPRTTKFALSTYRIEVAYGISDAIRKNQE